MTVLNNKTHLNHIHVACPVVWLTTRLRDIKKNSNALENMQYLRISPATSSITYITLKGVFLEHQVVSLGLHPGLQLGIVKPAGNKHKINIFSHCVRV